ncbi:hypothetical protein LBMAG15_13500 [Actinomycetes bacterium]|nr:hypothetical protein LBMAG15_13500 [Actinomycetes bacterium]
MDSGALSVIALAGVVIGVVGLVVAVIALVRLSHLRRSLVLLEAADGRETFVGVVARSVEQFHELRRDVADLDRVLTKTRHDVAESLRHVSVIRYDALGDLGGRYSFSAALLDDAGDGLVLTSIHGRAETRTYLKGLTGGKPDIELSPEEMKAVELARGARP